MKRILTILVLTILSAAAAAAAGSDGSGRHQVRLGWGDMLFETLAFHPSATLQYPNPEALPAAFSSDQRHDYGYTGHIFAGYYHRLTKVVSVGGDLDFEGIFWKETTFDRYRVPTGPSKSVRNYNLTILPGVQLTYLDTEWVRMYSGIGAGILLAMDNDGGFEVAPALNLNLVSVQVGKGHWYGALELGMLNALLGASKVYMAGSRLVSVSLNYKW